MTERRLKDVVGATVLIAHFGILLLALGLFLAKGFDQAEFTTALGIMAPMLAALTGLALTYILANKHRSRVGIGGKQVSSLYAFFALFIPFLFLIAMAGLLLLKVYNLAFSSFEEFKLSLVAMETIFGAYTGKVMASLFTPPTP